MSHLLHQYLFWETILCTEYLCVCVRARVCVCVCVDEFIKGQITNCIVKII